MTNADWRTPAIDFLFRLENDDLPFSSRHLDQVKEIMIFEEINGYTLRAKTGWAMRTTPQIGWFVGSLTEPEGVEVLFAMNIDLETPADADKRINITREVLSLLRSYPRG